MASRTSIENSAQKIAKYFSNASKEVINTIARYVLSDKNVPIEVGMRRVNGILKALGAKVTPIIIADIKWHYTSSALEVTNAMRGAGILTKGALDEQEIIELNSIISQSLNDYGEALSGAFNSAQKVMTDARKTAMEQIFVEGKLQGSSLAEVKKKIIENLQKDFVAIVDKGGRTWKLDRYAEMLTRTRMREVTNMGLVTRLQREGYDLVQVSSHPNDCEMCSPWDGKVLSITGRTPGYPTVDDATATGLFHPNCYDNKTEVYTKNGWKLFEDVCPDDLILSMNPTTLNMEYVNHLGTISYKYSGLMHHYKSNSFDLVVTPDHNMFIGYYGKRNGKREIKYRIERANRCPGNFLQIRHGFWEGREVKSPISLPIEDFAVLLGYFLSGGYVDISGYSRKVVVCQQKINRMGDDLIGMGFYKNNNKYLITNADWVEYFKQFGVSNKRFIPDWFMEARPDILRLFLDAYLLGDGSVEHTNKFKNFNSIRKVYFTTSGRLAGQLGELILKTGNYPSFYLSKRKGKAVKHHNGTYITNDDLWYVGENRSKHSYFVNSPTNKGRGIKFEEVSYNDLVWDLELEKNHVLLVRRNGRTAWSGNCRHRLLPFHPELLEYRVTTIA